MDDLVNSVVSNYEKPVSAPAPTTRSGGDTTSTSKPTESGGTTTTADVTGDSATCLLARPNNQTSENNTCYSRCQQQLREKEYECERLYRDVEDALAAKGCYVRLVPVTPEEMQNSCYPQNQNQYRQPYQQQQPYLQQYPTHQQYQSQGCQSGVCNVN